MKISHHDTDEKAFIIAEIGNNHEGDFDLAMEMVGLAAAAGADAVKFQTIVPNRLVSVSERNRIKQLTRFQFSADQFGMLAQEAARNNLVFLSTPFDLKAVDWLDELVPAYKIASGDNDFWPLLDRVARTGKPVMISTGFGKTSASDQLIRFFRERWGKYAVEPAGFGLLHCVVSYPTPLEEAGLSNISALKLPGVTPGYSDHTIGIRAAELAVGMGARIIEKHFTIDKQHSDFRDHQLSADPHDMRSMVRGIREVEAMLGNPDLPMQDCESGNKDPVRRSIAAARDLNAGERVEWDDLCWVRPGSGLRPGDEDKVCGLVLKKKISHGEAFTPEHFS